MSEKKDEGPVREKITIIYGPEDGYFHVDGPSSPLIFLGLLEMAKVSMIEGRTQASIKQVFDAAVAERKAKMEKPGGIIVPFQS